MSLLDGSPRGVHAQMGPVVAAIHAEPDRDWSVAALARPMGASRSSFATKFAEIVGETPARYLTQVRMHHASQSIVRIKLEYPTLRCAWYDSEVSFSRVFKRVIGLPPSRVELNKSL